MELNPSAATPLYVQLKLRLQQQIEEGIYTVGERLPSERELAEMYHVSRMTARQALQLLQQSGHVYTQVGKGTYVSRPKIEHELRRLTSFTEDMHNRGLQASSRVLKAEVRLADEETARRLELSPGDEIVLLSRIRMADGEPIAIEHAHLNHRRCRNILNNHDFSRESLYQVLHDQYNIRLVWASQEIEARMPDEEERRLLKLSARTPVLGLVRVTYDERNQPVEFVRSSYHGERYRLRVALYHQEVVS